MVGGSASAPASHTFAASRSVCLTGATRLPLAARVVAAARHFFASSSVGNVL